ncbi:MAG: hypothetical protein AAF579_00025 [Cyanobacteria bacterium P01_C01_bin.118]
MVFLLDMGNGQGLKAGQWAMGGWAWPTIQKAWPTIQKARPTIPPFKI